MHPVRLSAVVVLLALNLFVPVTPVHAGETCAIPRAGVELSGFTFRKNDNRLWRRDSARSEYMPRGGRDDMPAIQVSPGGKLRKPPAWCQVKLERGPVVKKPRLYLIRMWGRASKAGSHAMMGVRCDGEGRSVPTRGEGRRTRYPELCYTRTRTAGEWEELEILIRTPKYYPGQEHSTVRISLHAVGPGQALFCAPRILTIPEYGIFARYKVLHPTTSRYQGRVSILRTHRDTEHADGIRHRFSSSAKIPGPQEGIPAGVVSEWCDLRRHLFGSGKRSATASFRIVPAKGTATPEAIEAVIEMASFVGQFPLEKPAAQSKVSDLMAAENSDVVLTLEDEKEQKKAVRGYTIYSKQFRSSNGCVAFRVPEKGVHYSKLAERIIAVADDLAKRKAWLADLPMPIPRQNIRIPVGANFFSVANLVSPRIAREELELFHRIGITAIARGRGAGQSDAIREQVFGTRDFQDRAYLRLSGYDFISPYDDTRLYDVRDKQYRDLARDWVGSKNADKIKIIELWDEPGIFGIGECDLGAFRDFLRGKGIEPADVGAASWEAVLPYAYDPKKGETLPPPPTLDDEMPDRLQMTGDHLAMGLEAETDEVPVAGHEPGREAEEANAAGSADEAPSQTGGLPARRLKYFTHWFRSRKTSDFFRAATSRIEEHLPGKRTSVNFRAGYNPVLLGGTADWFQFGRDRAVTMMWNEDWLNTYGWRQNGVQLVSYYTEMMRTAARKHDLPIGGFLMCYWGQAELKSYAALSHGSRYLQYWRYGPTYSNPLYSWSHQKETVQAIATVCRDIAQIETALTEARRVPASTALLHAKADPLWGHSQAENRLVFLALMHDQVPLDIITEAQIEEDGLLDSYKTLYITDMSVRAKSQQRIADWVRRGGRLWLAGGAATRDEFDSPSDTILSVLGVQTARTEGTGKTIRQAAGEPEARGAAWALKVLGPGEHTVGLRFEDNAPAQITGKAGKGEFCVTAFRPGALYEAPVRARHNRARGKGVIQKGWLAARRAWMTDFVLQGRDPRPVRLSEPCVEVAAHRSEQGGIILLSNFSGEPHFDSLEVELRTDRTLRSLRSIRRGALAFRQDGGWVAFALPLDLTDSILFSVKPD